MSYDLEVLRSAPEVLQISSQACPVTVLKGITCFVAGVLVELDFPKAWAVAMQDGFDLGVLQLPKGHDSWVSDKELRYTQRVWNQTCGNLGKR